MDRVGFEPTASALRRRRSSADPSTLVPKASPQRLGDGGDLTQPIDHRRSSHRQRTLRVANHRKPADQATYDFVAWRRWLLIRIRRCRQAWKIGPMGGMGWGLAAARYR